MATEPTDLSHLDTETLTRFVDTDVASFLTLLGALKQDTEGHAVASMQYLASQLNSPGTGYSNTVLKLGKLGGDGDTAGGLLSAAPLLAFVGGAATALAAVEDGQEMLFTDIRDNLTTVLANMKKMQKDSLEDIESQSFLNDLRDVDTQLAPSQQA